MTKFNRYLFTTVKVVDLIYMMTIYFIVAFFVSLVIQKIIRLLFPDETNTQLQSKLLKFVKIIFSISLIVIVSYFLRNLIQILPFPFDGVAGFDHHKLKELQGGMLTTLLFLFNAQIFVEAKDLFSEFNGPVKHLLD